MGARLPSRRGKWLALATLLSLALATLFVVRPAGHLAVTAWNDVDTRQPTPAGMADDASRLNATPVDRVWTMPGDRSRGQAEAELAAVLAAARMKGLKVSIGGARHSMGGQSLYPGGLLVDMSQYDKLSLDDSKNILRAGAGARWSEIIPLLDRHGLSVAVMQSNSSFTVGGSVSVNCHGWQHDQPPIASTVQSLRMMLADGRVIDCSRDENAELFSLVLGGYGLFGVILEAELRVVPNRRYLPERHLIAAESFAGEFSRLVSQAPPVGMAYGRLRVTSDRFLEEAVLNIYRLDEADGGRPPPLAQAGYEKLRRALFRGSAASDYGKLLRWRAESTLEPNVRVAAVSRNTLLSESTIVFENRDDASTDILHEYFVPAERLNEFLASLREILPRSGANLLNVTIRAVHEDHDAFLRYADQSMFALVMLFHQYRTDAAEREMQSLTSELIDAAQRLGGRYYLPYRLHATQSEFEQAYPQANEFFRKKRHYDAEELFQNAFYAKYGEHTSPTRKRGNR